MPAHSRIPFLPILLLLACVPGFSGCGADEPAPEPRTAAEQREIDEADAKWRAEQQAEADYDAQVDAQIEAEQATLDAQGGGDEAAGLQAYLDSNFKDTSWYRYIDEAVVSGNIVDVRTTLVDDSDAVGTASDICAAVRGWGQADHIRVTDANDVSITKC